MGSFGYFPSYANGAIIASLLMQKARQKNVMEDIRRGDFSSINQYLDKNIRSKGSSKTRDELL